MNDNFHEQLITKKTKRKSVSYSHHRCSFHNFIFNDRCSVSRISVYYHRCSTWCHCLFYIFPNLSVEYEYSLVNHELDITAIYSKSKRKELCSFDIKEAEMIAPKGSSKLASFKPVKTCDYTSGEGNAAIYSIISFSKSADV